MTPKKALLFSKSVLDIKTRLVATVDLETKWMPNSDSASNFMPEYKFLGYKGLPNSLWLFKITRFFENYMDFPYENKSGGNFSPKFIFIWRSHIKILENSNFQTAVQIVWQVVLTQNFAFRHKFRCRIWIWHSFCFRFNGYHKPRNDVENRLREFEKSLNNGFLLNFFNTFRFWMSIHKLRVWHLNHSSPIKSLGDTPT